MLQVGSASELIRSLTKPTPRDMAGLGGCGGVGADRTAAKSLSDLGVLAIPDIEKALDSIEKRGEQSEFAFNSGWLLDAYARIKGPAGYPRLVRLIGNPALGFLRLSLDNAVALSLSITSYVSGSRVPVRIFDCRRPLEPRHALNQLILGWERNDRSWFEASLGPNAKAALKSLLGGRTWDALRAELWAGKSGDRVAVGYRFQISGHWSEPEETLDEDGQNGDTPVTSPNPELDTLFKTRSGYDCGMYRIKFLQTAHGGDEHSLPYLIDNSDLRDLLVLIASCATKK